LRGSNPFANVPTYLAVAHGLTSADPPKGAPIMAGGKTFKRDQKRRKEMARKLKQVEKARKKLEKRELQPGETDGDDTESGGLIILDPNVPI